MYTELSSLVITGGDHAATIGRATDREWNASQFLLVSHLNSCIETIHIDMNNFSLFGIFRYRIHEG